MAERDRPGGPALGRGAQDDALGLTTPSEDQAPGSAQAGQVPLAGTFDDSLEPSLGPDDVTYTVRVSSYDPSFLLPEDAAPPAPGPASEPRRPTRPEVPSLRPLGAQAPGAGASGLRLPPVEPHAASVGVERPSSGSGSLPSAVAPPGASESLSYLSPDGRSLRSSLDAVTAQAAAEAEPLADARQLLSFPWLQEPDAWRAGAIVAGRYRLLSSLGTGGMGDVLLADDLLLRRKVALKTLRRNLATDGRALDRFRQEVAMAHAVSHIGLARTFDMGEAGGVVYLTMEYLEGETLAQRIKREGPLPEAEVRRIALEVIAALEAAHLAGVVHRDLKPSNIQLTPDRGAVVMDFGLAAGVPSRPTARQPAGRSELVRASSRSVGTPYYMAPEQWRGEAQGIYTDVYAFGCILFEALTGRKPFLADDRAGMMRAHLQDTPPTVRSQRPGVSRTLDALVGDCLRKDPALRPPSMAALGQRLVQQGLRYHALTGLVAVAVLALFVAGGWVIWSTASALILRQMQPSVQRLAMLLARDIQGADLNLVHRKGDMKKKPFQRVHSLLQRYKRENPEVRYLYTLRKLPERSLWEFVVDADPYDRDTNGDGVIQPAERGSPPGMKYDGSEFPWMWRTFSENSPQVDDAFESDPWGLVLSGYAPVPAPGADFYLVGVDVGYAPLRVLRNTLYAVGLLLGLVSACVVIVLRRRRGRGAGLGARPRA